MIPQLSIVVKRYVKVSPIIHITKYLQGKCTKTNAKKRFTAYNGLINNKKRSVRQHE